MKPGLVLTGAAGFLGSASRARLHSHYRLFSTDRNPIDNPYPDEVVFLADLEDAQQRNALWDQIRTHSAVGIVHYAAFYDFTDKPNARYDRLLEALRDLLQRFHSEFPDDSVFVLATSMAAMAPTIPGTKLTELSPRLGAWEYPRSKLAAEAVFASAFETTPCRHRSVELVFAGVYSDWAELVPLYQAIERVRSGSIEKYFLPAPPTSGLTYVHLEDAVESVVAALARAPKGHSRYLIGEPAPVSYQTLHRSAATRFWGKPIPLFRIPSLIARWGAWWLSLLAKRTGRQRFIQPWMIAFAGEHFEFDLSKTTRDLGWSPRRFLGDELTHLVAKAHEQPEEWKRRNRLRPW